MLMATGCLKYLFDILNHIIGSLPEMPEEMIVINRYFLNTLIVIIVKAILANEINKNEASEHLEYWLTNLQALNYQGKTPDAKIPKTFFSSKNFSFETESNQNIGKNRGDRSTGKPKNLGGRSIDNSTFMVGKNLLSVSNKRLVSPISEDSIQYYPFSGNLVSLILQTLNNNKKVNTDSVKSSRIIRLILDNITRTYKYTANMFIMAEYINCLEQLLFVRNEPIQSNQNSVMQILIEKGKVGVLGRFHSSNLVQTLENDLKNQPFVELICEITNSTSSKATVLLGSANFCFDLAYIELLALCCFGKNEYAEKIAQSFLSLEYEVMFNIGI